MVKPFDISKFRKSITKNITGVSTGFNDPDTWISTGSYGLNYLISGDFYKGIPLGKVTVFAGDPGAGKSYIVSANVVKNAQEQGIFPLIIDSENALDESWLKKLGVDTSPDKLLKVNLAKIDDVAALISDFVKLYKDENLDKPKEERPKIIIIVDSLGMLVTQTEISQFEAGDMKGDMGRKAKQLKALVTNCINMFGELNIGLVATNHVYASQDMFDPDDKISGGNGFVFASSVVVAMKKLKLKEDEDGNKVSDVTGIRSVCKVVKSRFSKPFESIKIDIPYSTGMNPVSGLIDLFEKANVLKKDGNKLVYVDKETGEIMKFFRKEWNDFDKLSIIMKQFSDDDLIHVEEKSTDEDKTQQENV